jgi:small multidrug resistance family-3 protein
VGWATYRAGRACSSSFAKTRRSAQRWRERRARGLAVLVARLCFQAVLLSGGSASMRFVTVLRSLLLFLLAAVAEIGGAWLVWQGVREHRGLLFVGAGVVALGAYGFVATLQPDSHFGRILAAYGGIFVAGSLAWGMLVDGFRPDRYDLIGALMCLAGVAVIMYAPRGA